MPRIDITMRQEVREPAINISAGGMCVLSKLRVPEGATVELSFRVPDANRDGFDHIVNCSAKVIWCRPSRLGPNLFEVGLQFTEISNAEQEAVADFVAAQLPEPPKAASGAPDPKDGHR